MTGCGSGEDGDTVGSTTPVDTTTSAATTGTTTLPVVTTSAPSSSTVPPPEDPVSDPVLWAAAEYTGPGLDWEPAGLSIDRSEDLWLGFVGDRAVLLAWNQLDGLRIRHSDDGINWSEFVAADEIPDGFRPVFDHPSTPVASGPHGIIMTGFEPGDPILTSLDGTSWAPVDYGRVVESVAAGPEGFLIAGADLGKCAAQVLEYGSPWECIDVMGGAATWGGMAMAGGTHFLVDFPGRAPVVIGKGEVRSMPSPAPQAPLFNHSTPWGNGLLAIARGFFSGAGAWRMALVGTDDYQSWFELPVPFIGAATDWTGDGYWNVETLAAGDRGILVTAFWPPDDFDFRGGAFVSIPFSVAGLEGWIFGSRVFLMPPDEDGVISSFDADGNLTLSDAESGEELGMVSCQEMKAFAENEPFLPGGLVGWPDQQLAYSPEGAAWEQTSVAGVFGTDAYVLQLAVNGGLALALVAPNGDRPTPDPPNCPLDLYPVAEPFEVWVAELP